jgi:hypothetical protein
MRDLSIDESPVLKWRRTGAPRRAELCETDSGWQDSDRYVKRLWRLAPLRRTYPHITPELGPTRYATDLRRWPEVLTHSTVAAPEKLQAFERDTRSLVKLSRASAGNGATV